MANCPIDNSTVLTKVTSTLPWTILNCSSCGTNFISFNNMEYPLSTIIKLETKTPVNAVAATGKIVFGGTPSDGNTVTINGRAYTFKTALSTGPTVAYEVLIDGTNNSASNLNVAIMKGATEGTNYGTGTVANVYVTSAVSTDTVTITSKIKGTLGNDYTLTKAGTNITVSAATMGSGVGCTAGVNGTLGKIWDMFVDTSYLYICTAANTTADTNWKRVDLGSAY